MVQLNLNWNLLPMKAQFFLWNAGTAPIVPFLPTYARQLGFSSFIVGTIYMVLPVTGMLAKPLFGALADRRQCQKTLFIVFQVVTALSFFMIQFVPEILSDSRMHLDCDTLTVLKMCTNKTADICSAEQVIANAGHGGILYCQVHCNMADETLLDEVCHTWNVSQYCSTNSSSTYKKLPVLKFQAEVPLSHTISEHSCVYFQVHHVTFFDDTKYVPFCNKLISTECHVKCQNPAIMDIITQPVNDSDVSALYQFWVFFTLLIISWVGMAVVVSLGDAICFGLLGDDASKYGNQRLWGAIGWGVFSVIAGVLVDEFSKGQSKKNYTAIFYLMIVMLVLDTIVSSRLKYSQTKHSTSITKDVGKLVREPRIIIFMLWTITVGLCTGLLWQFLFWHLEDLALESGCDMQRWVKTLEGLVMGIQCFGGELPFFFLSGNILRKIGHVNAMTLVLLGIAVRFILYSLLTNPWWCLPIELFQGITFGIFYATMASYASIVAPPGTEATVQGLVGALFEGVGVSLGSLLGGVLFDMYGGGTTFLMYGIGSLVMFFVHAGVQYFLSSRPQYTIHDKGFDNTAHYALPTEAIHMLEDEQQLSPS